MNYQVGSLLLFAAVLTAPTSTFAQEASPAQNQPVPTAASQQANEITPVYRIQVVGREIPAINYFHRRGPTEIGFEGTSLLPQVHGSARVDALAGRTQIQASLENLVPANSLGPEYLTYVLWAITPEGRPVNLGEVLPTGKKNKSQITVTTNLQTFGLVVTAEPYFAVTMPSDVVVAQNVVLHNTHGEIEQINAHYSLLPRGAYAQIAGRPAPLHPITRDERLPLELYEAENAVNIARAGGADQYAPDSMASASAALAQAENQAKHKNNRKESITYAREAVQAAEDARIITIRKMKAADEQAQEQATKQAQQTAQEQAAARQQAELATQAAQLQQQQAEQRAAAAQQQQQQAEQQAQLARQQQLSAEQQAAAARQAEQQATQNAQQMAQQARDSRERLRQQLNQVLQTRETAQGLIMNMPDVLFGFDKYNLKPEAREKLARVSGILLAYPDLKVQVEGYTDNVGSEEYNQKLSNQRADTVHDFLVSQNVPAANVTAQGHGASDPVADNSTSSGRAQNRRVELIVTGAAIGIEGTQGQNTPGGDQPGTVESATH
jgi:outer membrane protein OmpA-like peptidoglycan-associated protein